MFRPINLFSNNKSKLLEQERKVTRWLVNERRDSISQYFSQNEFDQIMNRVNEELNNRMKSLYPKENERYRVMNRINNDVTNCIRNLYQKVGKETDGIALYNLNKISENVLKLATLRDDANAELEKFMDNIIKDGRTQLTQVEFQKYKELKSKVDEYDNLRQAEAECLRDKKCENDKILQENNIKDEYNFLFGADPMSEEFMFKYFPSLKK